MIIFSETPDAVIYYATDGNTPTESSTKYTGPISVAETTTKEGIKRMILQNPER
ncbi:MAG: chitobiase/beta-hexosaminidase C-terminal domain-containing protein [Lachnospiraceae bacterium]|nr:chitobiase/beta-hexosaminidase C-terminal domain-containing protein [Lachnospiraceae bacterium]